MLTTAQSGIWIGLLVTSLWEPAKNIQDTFDRAWRAVKTFLDYLLFISYQNWTRFLCERSVSSSIAIRSLATIWTAAMYIFCHFKVRVASQDRRVVI